MEENEIKSLLALKSVTQTSIARSLTPPVTVQAVNNVIRGDRSTPRIQAAIAVAVGKEVHEIWPDTEAPKKEAA